jgi:hypothetical protein
MEIAPTGAGQCDVEAKIHLLINLCNFPIFPALG